jgi:hypothetical protein
VSKFLTELDARCIDDGCWILLSNLRYESDLMGMIDVPAGFQTDFASIPRWIPIVSAALLDRAHREAVIHDFCYRSDSLPPTTRKQADLVFLEAMQERGKGVAIRNTMYAGVRAGGWTAYHKKKVADPL